MKVGSTNMNNICGNNKCIYQHQFLNVIHFHLCQFVPFLFNPIPFLVFLFFNFYTSYCFSYLLLFPLLSTSTLFPFFVIYLNFFCCLSSSFIYSFSSIFKCIIVNIFQFYSRPIFLFIDFFILSLF